MRIERTKNAKRNIVYGSLLKIYQILIPFVMRTAMIYIMGAEYLGLNSLFVSILSVLNLAELGVGSAMVYSMYKPIAEDDTDKICALMKLYRRYYRLIGAVILLAGLLLIPFLPQLIKIDTVPDDINITILYLMNLAATVLTYWLFSYKNCLLSAHQRIDISSKITLISSSLTYALQFAVLFFLHDYYLYTLIVVLIGAVNNCITAFIVDRMYPEYRPKGQLDKEEIKIINQKVKDLFTAKLGGTIVGSSDTLVISAFLGLTLLAMYQNYFFIMSSVLGFVQIIFQACTAGIGNSLAIESAEKNYFDFRKLSFLTVWIATICISCFTCLYQPFITLWVGEKFLLSIEMVFLMCAYFYLQVINQLSCLYKDAAGMWHEDRFRPLVGGLTNLVLNLLLVQFIGIYGVILSTILSYAFVVIPWLIHNLFKLVFKRSWVDYVGFILKGVIISGFSAEMCYLICNAFEFGNIVIQLAFNAVICCSISTCVFLVFNMRNTLLIPTLDLLNGMARGKLNRIICPIKLISDHIARR